MKVTSVAVFVTLAGILGCSTPQPGQPRLAAVMVPTSEPPPPPALNLPLDPEIRPYPAPPDEHLPEVYMGKPCQLGKSCLAMDPRPFELCLLSTTKRCGDKMVETMRVGHADDAAR